jgi:hypothetical protein
VVHLRGRGIRSVASLAFVLSLAGGCRKGDGDAVERQRRESASIDASPEARHEGATAGFRLMVGGLGLKFDERAPKPTVRASLPERATAPLHIEDAASDVSGPHTTPPRQRRTAASAAYAEWTTSATGEPGRALLRAVCRPRGGASRNLEPIGRNLVVKTGTRAS